MKKKKHCNVGVECKLGPASKISNMAERISPLIKKKLQRIEFQI